MGGRGASSGLSNQLHKYGSDYQTIFTSGNIKFVRKKRADAESLIETMTKNRVYALIGKDNKIKSIIYMGSDLVKKKELNLNHSHKGIQPHVHHGRFHNEYDGIKGATKPNVKESSMIDRVQVLWNNYLNKQKAKEIAA